MTVLQNIALGLSDLLLTLAALLLLARALLFSMNADPFHPLIKLIIACTNPVLALPHKLIPPMVRVDLACWLCAFLVCLFELYLRVVINGGDFHVGLLPFALVQMVELVLYILLVSVLGVSIASWFMSPHQLATHPLISLFHLLTAPMLNLIRRFIPRFGPVDISPMVLLVVVYLIFIVLRSVF